MHKSTITLPRHAILVAALLAARAGAQEVPAIFVIDVENYVSYVDDVTDPARVARSVAPVAPANARINFNSIVLLADVTRINGAPAKGVMVIQSQSIRLTPNPAPGPPGAAIADVTRPAYAQMSWELLKPDGSQIGNIYGTSLSGGTPSPGSPVGAEGGSVAISGGTGAFLGARGTINFVELVNVRTASQAEDPSMRRTNGGGRARFVFQVFPMFRPEVAVGPGGPLVFHSDNTPVSADKPARPGEELILHAKGLGPTRPGVNLGDPFPDDPPAVTSPVEMLVNDKSSPVIEAAGLPGSPDTYRVKFRAPDDTPAGMMTVQISAAWIKGAVVRIPVG